MGTLLTLSSAGVESPVGDTALNVSTNAYNTAAVLPAANRIFLVPVVLEIPATVVKMSFIVATQAGNYDIGIYDLAGVRRVALGSTAVPVAGLAVADVADTYLVPGVYFLAFVGSSVTASINRASALGAASLRAAGMQIVSAGGGPPLPTPITFANPADAYVPLMSAHLVPTV
jgi:hypothetical protein